MINYNYTLNFFIVYRHVGQAYTQVQDTYIFHIKLLIIHQIFHRPPSCSPCVCVCVCVNLRIGLKQVHIVIRSPQPPPPTNARTRAHTHTCTCTCTCTCTRARTRARTHARTHAHTHTHTHIYLTTIQILDLVVLHRAQHCFNCPSTDAIFF
jgi:hypothetical protein